MISVIYNYKEHGVEVSGGPLMGCVHPLRLTRYYVITMITRGTQYGYNNVFYIADKLGR